jgi:hypothetical protein
MEFDIPLLLLEETFFTTKPVSGSRLRFVFSKRTLLDISFKVQICLNLLLLAFW